VQKDDSTSTNQEPVDTVADFLQRLTKEEDQEMVDTIKRAIKKATEQSELTEGDPILDYDTLGVIRGAIREVGAEDRPVGRRADGSSNHIECALRFVESLTDGMRVERCPYSCRHETFHYCNEVGTHCDKHCACSCWQCVEAKRNPPPVDPTMGGSILPGSTVVQTIE
jgi:hypothetical protein